MNREAIVQEVLARYALKHYPVRIQARNARMATTMQEMLTGVDPKVIERSSAVTLKSRDHDQFNRVLTYRATSGGKTYTVKIEALPEEGKRHYWESNLLVACTCPYFKWQGTEYHANKNEYLADPEYPRSNLSVPSIRDPLNNHLVCKHIYKALQKSQRIYYDYVPKVLR